jgi:hypothetical protein
LYIAVTLARFGDPLAFATICSDVNRVSSGHCGYDGQFAYAIAVDPLNAPALMDVAAYRYQRILYPMLARVLGWGQRGLIAWTLIAINFAALLAGTAIVEALLRANGASRWYALAYGLFAGVLMPLRLDLTEPMAYALALAAVWATTTGRRPLTAGALLALAALTKETTLLFAAALVAYHALHRRMRDALIVGAAAAIPFAIWQLILFAQFGQFGVGSGGALGTPFEAAPLRGWWALASIDLTAFIVISLIMLPMAIIPAVIALIAVVRDFVRRRFDLAVMLLFFNAVVVLFTPQSTFREPLGMARFIVGLVASVLIYASTRGSRRALNYALLWIFTLAFAINT